MSSHLFPYEKHYHCCFLKGNTLHVSQDFAPLFVGEQSGHGGDRAHLDRVSVETREHAVQTGEVAAHDELAPMLEIPFAGLAAHVVAEMREIMLDPRSPGFEAPAVEQRGLFRHFDPKRCSGCWLE